MKIVLDTNVLVSGLLNPYGAPGRIVQMVVAERVSLRYDARILCEYRDVLLRPAFSFPPQQVEELLSHIRAVGDPTAALPLSSALPDRDDTPFLEVAIAGKVEYLVTGNPRHFPVAGRRGIRVISPAEFVKLFGADESHAPPA